MPRPVPLRRLPSLGVLAAALVLAGLAVLLVVGIWASRLGAPPQWAFDCDDTTCTDLWADARLHYLRVTALAGIVTLLGAALGSLTVPTSPVPPPPVLPSPAPRRNSPAPGGPLLRPHRKGSPTLLRLLGPMLLASALLWGAGWSALALSRPSGLAVALAALLLAVVAAWRWVRPGTRSDRAACWAAAAGILVPMSVGAVLLAHPMTLLGVVLLVGSPLLGVPTLAVVLLGATALMSRLLPRADEPVAPDLASASRADLTAAPGGGEGAPEPAARRASTPLTVVAVVVIAVLAVVSARPVPAPPADAWRSTETAEDVGTGTDAVAPERPPTEQGPEPGSRPTGSSLPAPEEDPAPSAPALAADGLPECSPPSLQVVAGDWDGHSGDSAATLRATNVGAAPCALRGAPRLTLEQGGAEIRLRPEPLTSLEPAARAPDGLGLAPGETARSRLYWPGYRSAADQRTPQRLTVRISAAEEPVPVGFGPASSGDDPGPAPFDLKAGVEGGAVIEVGPWEPAPRSAG